MARRKPHEEHGNHEAWAIPYADLMTLLLAFFVVMYAISSVNEGKYKVMADALTTAFGGIPRTVSQVQVGNQQLKGASADTHSALKASSGSDAALLSGMAAQMRTAVSLNDQQALQRAERQLTRIADRLSAALAPLVKQGVISVRRTELWIEVEINSDILFDTGSASLDASAREVLNSLADVLVDVPNGIRVEGHTDNVPIATAQFPSNWELSAARAASVVHLFADHGLSPERLAMVGYGEFRPREANDQAEGRNRNRRVMVIILADSAQTAETLAEDVGAASAALSTPQQPSTSNSTGQAPAPAASGGSGSQGPDVIEGVH